MVKYGEVFAIKVRNHCIVPTPYHFLLHKEKLRNENNNNVLNDARIKV